MRVALDPSSEEEKLPRALPQCLFVYMKQPRSDLAEKMGTRWLLGLGQERGSNSKGEEREAEETSIGGIAWRRPPPAALLGSPAPSPWATPSRAPRATMM